MNLPRTQEFPIPLGPRTDRTAFLATPGHQLCPLRAPPPGTGTWPQPPKAPGTPMSPSRARYGPQSSLSGPGSRDGSFSLSPIRRMLRAISVAGGWFSKGLGGGRAVPKKKCNVMVRVCPPHPLWGPKGTRRDFVGLWRPRRDGQGDGREVRHGHYLGPKCPPLPLSLAGDSGWPGRKAAPNSSWPPAAAKKSAGRRQERRRRQKAAGD